MRKEMNEIYDYLQLPKRSLHRLSAFLASKSNKQTRPNQTKPNQATNSKWAHKTLPFENYTKI